MTLKIRFLRAMSLALLALSCVACDGVYSATSDGNGNVVIVNRFTGEARSVRGSTIVDVKPPLTVGESPKSPSAPHRPVLYPLPINDQPFSIHGASKFRDGKLLVQVSINPTNPSMTEPEWTVWRNHLKLTQQSGVAINLQFTDKDGFEIASQRIPLPTMTQTLGLDDKVGSLEEQISMPMSEDSYNALDGWNVTWQGFWPPYSSPPEAHK